MSYRMLRRNTTKLKRLFRQISIMTKIRPIDGDISAVSSNMIEGWQPKVAFIEKMRRRMIELRKGIANV